MVPLRWQWPICRAESGTAFLPLSLQLSQLLSLLLRAATGIGHVMWKHCLV